MPNCTTCLLFLLLMLFSTQITKQIKALHSLVWDTHVKQWSGSLIDQPEVTREVSFPTESHSLPPQPSGQWQSPTHFFQSVCLGTFYFSCLVSSFFFFLMIAFVKLFCLLKIFNFSNFLKVLSTILYLGVLCHLTLFSFQHLLSRLLIHRSTISGVWNKLGHSR